jgi:hypothetical protein
MPDVEQFFIFGVHTAGVSMLRKKKSVKGLHLSIVLIILQES